MRKIHLSIRSRIIALIGGAIALSLFSYLYMGSKLVIQDKTSYIYDYSFSQVRMTSLAIQHELDKFYDFKNRIQSQDSQAIAHEFLIEQGYLQANYLVILNRNSVQPNSKQLITEQQIGIDISHQKLPWSNELLASETDRLAIDSAAHTITLAVNIQNSRLAVMQLKMAHSLFDGTAKDFQILIIDEAGRIIANKDPKATAELNPFPKTILESLSQSEFDTGVREVQINQTPYLMGYDQVMSSHVFILSFVPSALALSAATTLAKKSLGLGITVFLLALGFTLLLIRSLLLRVKELVTATERVSAGDFTTKINVSDSAQDELTSLAVSFNIMGEEIKKLLKATAMAARMEQELETAQMVQSRFFPPRNLKTPNLHLDATSITASECGGDWWHYAHVQNYLVVIMGDVTGHGASAALVTASIHSAFSLLIAELQRVKRPLRPDTEILGILANSLNNALMMTAGELSTFPCLLAAIDLTTLQMSIFNAGHPQPFLFQGGARNYIPLATSNSMPLGQKDFQYDPKVFVTELKPGDQVLWYTDGLFDSRISDGKKIKKKELLTELKGKTDLILKSKNLSTNQSLADFVLSQAKQFFGDDPNNRPDDITVLSLAVPLTANVAPVEQTPAA